AVRAAVTPQAFLPRPLPAVRRWQDRVRRTHRPQPRAPRSRRRMLPPPRPPAAHPVRSGGLDQVQTTSPSPGRRTRVARPRFGLTIFRAAANPPISIEEPLTTGLAWSVHAPALSLSRWLDFAARARGLQRVLVRRARTLAARSRGGLPQIRRRQGRPGRRAPEPDPGTGDLRGRFSAQGRSAGGRGSARIRRRGAAAWLGATGPDLSTGAELPVDAELRRAKLSASAELSIFHDLFARALRARLCAAQRPERRAPAAGRDHAA